MAEAYAQDLNREVYPKQSSIEHNQAVKSFSSDYLLLTEGNSSRIGISAMLDRAHNIASINMGGQENMAQIIQQGLALYGLIVIEGLDNQVSLLQQGADLQSTINMQGNHNQFDMIQRGEGLHNYIDISGMGLQYNAIQTNGGFQLQQQGQGSIPIRIEHSGTMIPVRIDNYKP
ncbi:MAG: hypothetical protein ACQETE_13450 [Bacteroidota bacterium]